MTEKGLYAEVKQFIKERDKAVLSMDIDTFKAFYAKWAKKGFYNKDMLPGNDRIIYISMMKMILAIKSAPDAKKKKARKWLHENGFTEEIFNE